jgi:hypothetical protein
MAKKSLKFKKILFLFAFSKKLKKKNRQNKATPYKAQWTGLLGLPNPIIVQNGHAPWTNHENHYIIVDGCILCSFLCSFHDFGLPYCACRNSPKAPYHGQWPKKTCPLCGFVPCTGNPKRPHENHFVTINVIIFIWFRSQFEDQ